MGANQGAKAPVMVWAIPELRRNSDGAGGNSAAGAEPTASCVARKIRSEDCASSDGRAPLEARRCLAPGRRRVAAHGRPEVGINDFLAHNESPVII